MPGLDPIRQRGSLWAGFLALLCVALVLLAGTAQAVHMHADGTDTHTNCSLCAAAHVTLGGVQGLADAPPVRLVRTVEVRQELPPARLNLIFTLYDRPPPVA